MSPVRLLIRGDELGPSLAVRQQSSVSNPTDTALTSASSTPSSASAALSTSNAINSAPSTTASASLDLPYLSSTSEATSSSSAASPPPTSPLPSLSSPGPSTSLAADDRLSAPALNSLANSLPKYLAIGGILLGIVIFLAVLSCVYRSYKRRKRLGGGLASAPPPPPLKASSRTATTRRKFTDKPGDIEQGWKEYRRMSEAATSEPPSPPGPPRGVAAGRRPLRSMSKETLKSARSAPRCSQGVKSLRGQTPLRECMRSESPDEDRATQTRRESTDSYQDDRKSSLDLIELSATPVQESRTLIDGPPRERGERQ